MWQALAVWFIMQPPMMVPVVKLTFDTKSECVTYITDNSDFTEVVFDQHHAVMLDDGTKDMFGVACITRTNET